MRTALLAALMLVAPLLPAENHYVMNDGQSDFTAFKTFMIRQGPATSRIPEFNSKHTFKTVEDAIRSNLSSKGLKETPVSPDLIVTFNLSDSGESTTRGVRSLQASLAIDMTRPRTFKPVWQGFYSDNKIVEGALAKNLSDGTTKLLSQFPPKKKD